MTGRLDVAQDPYCETFTMIWPDGEDASPDTFFACNICGRRLDDDPCPDHAPLDVPGLQRAECDATPGHPRTWMLASDGYPPPCMYCVADGYSERIRFLERCRHRWWRRTRFFGRLASHAYGMGLVASYATSFGGGEYDHHGCVHGFHWRSRRPYLLGWPTWKWRCLLRMRHWPGVFVGLGMCSKCLPCDVCGSSTTCLDGPCENQAEAS